MLLESEAQRSALFENAGDYVWSVDAGCRLLTFNPSFQQILEQSFGTEAAVGMRPEEFLPPDNAAEWHSLYRRALTVGPSRTEYPIADDFILEMSMNPIHIDGEVSGVAVIGRDITGQKLSNSALRDSEERYRATIEQAAVGIAHVSFEGHFLECNARFAEIVGCEPDEIPGMSIERFTPAEFRPETLEILRQLQTGESTFSGWEKPCLRKDGSQTWVRLIGSVQRDSHGQPTHIVAFAEDINDRKKAEARASEATLALEAGEERYRTVFQTSLDAINITRAEDGAYIDCNPAFLRIIGYEREEVMGKGAVALGIWADLADRRRLLDALSRESSCRDLEAQFRKKDGSLIWGLMSASMITLKDEPCILSITRDITAAKAAEEEIRALAYFDPLTNLPNRRLLLDRLSETPGARIRKRTRALLYIDLDDFKMLNDVNGHQNGDLFLKEVASRLTSCIRDCDTVARLGADEFVVVLDGLRNTQEAGVSQAEAFAERVLNVLRKPFLLGGKEIHKTASIGVTVFNPRPGNTNEALREAEIAMHQAKSAGRNTIQFFAPGLQAAVNARAVLEQELREAVKAREFMLYYQPQIQGTQLVGLEALLRWNHPERGILAPAEFMQAIEETGLIHPIGDWVLKTIAEQLVSWSHSKQMADIPISVNISPLQFRQPKFVEKAKWALASSGANPRNLIMELTESIFVDDMADVICKMTALKGHGVRFSLDDFGTGFSSLSYLKHLPLDQLKIDRAFVKDILDDVASGAIAQTIVSLGRALGLSVIAEGVETREQESFLNNLGCNTFQGFLFSRPIPAESLQKLASLRKRRSGQIHRMERVPRSLSA